MRVLVVLAIAAVCLALGLLIRGPGPAPLELFLVLSLMGMALAIYVWGLYPMAGAASISAVVALCLLWGWAVQQRAELGMTMAAFGLLVAAAIVQRRRRAKRFLQMSQLLDDLEEDRTVKNQAIRLAQQTRENLQKKHARYQRLQSIAEELSNLVEVGAISQLAVDRAFELIGKSEVCLLFLVDKDRQALSLFASRKAGSVKSVWTKHGDQFDRYVLRTHRPLLVNDVRRDFRFTMVGAQSRPIGAVIACPLLLNQSAEGVLRLDSAQPDAYTQDDLRFLDILLNLVATAVANARLFAKTQQLAMTDGLTGLLLRRPFLEQLEHAFLRAERSREPMSVLMLDLDSFKAYNDTYGHTAGDAVLVAVADVLRQVVPPDGVTVRYGGEEFAVLLPHASSTQAQRRAERIRATVERDLTKVSRADHPAVTVSVGLASFPGDAHASLELIRVADQRLYEAKQQGRNRVCGPPVTGHTSHVTP